MILKKIFQLTVGLSFFLMLFCCTQTGEYVIVESHIGNRHNYQNEKNTEIYNNKNKEEYNKKTPKNSSTQDSNQNKGLKYKNTYLYDEENAKNTNAIGGKDNASTDSINKNISEPLEQQKEYKKIETVITNKKESEISKNKIRILIPVGGPIVKEFNPNEDSTYEGIIIETENKSNVYASLDGVIVYVGEDLVGEGEMIIIEHDNDILTTYANLDSSSVIVGQEIKKGQKIGQSGITKSNIKPRILFFMRINGEPCDPLAYID